MGQVCQTATQDDEEYVVVKSKKTVKSKGPNRTEPIRIKPKSAASKRKQYVTRNDEDPAVRGNFHKDAGKGQYQIWNPPKKIVTESRTLHDGTEEEIITTTELDMRNIEKNQVLEKETITTRITSPSGKVKETKTQQQKTRKPTREEKKKHKQLNDLLMSEKIHEEFVTKRITNERKVGKNRVEEESITELFKIDQFNYCKNTVITTTSRPDGTSTTERVVNIQRKGGKVTLQPS